jgi:hypothetical protein
MAIDSTNSNSVNISNLPKSQIAVDGDLLILQTDNGTQTIDFSDFNVVKTDAAGNATVIGDLSGNKGVLNTGLFKNALSAASYYSNNIPGVNNSFGFYNVFTISNGLITSADYRIGSTEYNTIVNTVIPAVTANQTKVYKYVAYADNETSPIAIPPGFRRAPTDFIISKNINLTTTPYIYKNYIIISVLYQKFIHIPSFITFLVCSNLFLFKRQTFSRPSNRKSYSF